MAYMLSRNPIRRILIGPGSTVGTRTGFSLSSASAFILGTQGNCLGWRFVAPATTTITDVAFFITAAPGSANNLTCHICNHGAAAYLPGSSIQSATVSGGTTASKWIKATFGTPASITRGVVYWLVVGDAAVAASGYSLASRGGSVQSDIDVPNALICCSSVNGFSTAGAAVSSPPCAVLYFGDSTYMGNPYTESTTDTSNQRERGLKIVSLTEKLTICGAVFNGHANMSTIQMYEGDTIPGGTIWSGFNGGAAITLDTSSKSIGVVMFPDATLSKGTIYRFSFKYGGGNSTNPGYMHVEDAATAESVFQSLGYWGAANLCRTISDGGAPEAWVDNDDAVNGIYAPRIGLIVQDQVAIAAGGGGFPILGGSIVR